MRLSRLRSQRNRVFFKFLSLTCSMRRTSSTASFIRLQTGNPSKVIPASEVLLDASDEGGSPVDRDVADLFSLPSADFEKGLEGAEDLFALAFRHGHGTCVALQVDESRIGSCVRRFRAISSTPIAVSFERSWVSTVLLTS